MRYRLLETLRQYGQQKLAASGEGDVVRERHAQYWLGVVEAAPPELRGPRQVETFDALEREHDNLRAALEWWIGRGDAAQALRLAGALWELWWFRSYYTEGRAWLARALALPGAEAPTAERAKALWAAGFLAGAAGDRAVGDPLFAEALPIAAEVGDVETTILCHYSIGLHVSLKGRDKEALEHRLQGLALARQHGDQMLIGLLLWSLGGTAMRMGDLDAARDHLDNSLRAFRAAGNPWGIANALMYRGNFAIKRSDTAAARRDMEESLSIMRRIGHLWGLGTILDSVGRLAHQEGDLAVARERLEEAVAVERQMERPPLLAPKLVALAGVLRDQGERDAARERYEQALAIWEELGEATRGADVRKRLERLERVAPHSHTAPMSET